MNALSNVGYPHFISLVRRSRRRIWFDSVVRWLCRAIWWAGALILAAAVVHALGVPLSWRHSLPIALAVPVVALAAALLCCRPTTSRAAARLDDVLGSRELMVSALAQASLPPQGRAGAAGVVLQQAERLAATAGAAKNIAGHDRLRASALIPVGLAGAGLMLHLNTEPGGALSVPAGRPVATGYSAAGSTPEAPPAGPILDLKRSLMKIAASMAEDSRRAAATGSKGPKRSLVRSPVTGRTDRNVARHEPEPPSAHDARDAAASRGRGARPAGSQRPSGTLPGAGSNASARLKRGETPAVDMAVSYLEMERGRTTDRSVRGYALSDAMPLSKDGGIRGADAVAPGERVDVPYEMTFPPAMGAYVRAYLFQLQRNQ